MEPDHLDVVLASLIDPDVPHELTVVFAANAECRALPDLSGRELDNLLRELLHRGWLTAERQEGDGSVVWWS